MHVKVINEAPERTYALILDTGDEAVRQLSRFAADYNLTAAHFTAIGAFRSAVLGYFNWDTKSYERIPVDEQVEVLALVGDVALQDTTPRIHSHVVVGKRDGSAHGGHLLEAYVRPTLEVILVESPSYLKRTSDPASGLPLINIGA